MKTNFFAGLSSLVFSLVLLTGCQKEELSIPQGKITPREEACCVNSFPSAPELVYTGTHGVTVTAYNDATTTYVTISRAAGVMTLRYRNPGVCPTPTTGATVCEGCTSWSTSFPNPTGWECGDPVTFSFYLNGLGGPPPNTLQTCVITYNLKNVCGCPFEGNSFSGTADAGSCDETRGATYTLCSEDGLDYFKIQGGLTNFTGDDAVVTVTGGTGVTIEQRTPGGSSNRIVTVEGGLDECSCATVHVTWNSTNTGGTITGEWSAKDHVDLIPGTSYTAELPCVE